MKKNLDKISSPGKSKSKALLDFALFAMTSPGMKVFRNALRKKLHRSGIIKQQTIDYNLWIAAQADNGKVVSKFANMPRFSILLPVNDTIPDTVIHSITAQAYTNWELFITCTPDGEKQLQQYRVDPRVHISPKQVIPTLSDLLKDELPNATGTYIVLMDQHYALAPHYLYELAKQINSLPDTKIIYTDEDTRNKKGKYSNPIFKPALSPDLLLTHNYIGDVYCMQRAFLNTTLHIHASIQFANVYELLLIVTSTSQLASNILQVLVHKISATIGRRYTEEQHLSTKKAIEAYLQWSKLDATVEPIPGVEGKYRVNFKHTDAPKVSILIPTKDQVTLLKTTLDSVFQKTDYPDFEVILINNNSTSPEFFELVKAYSARHSNFTCIDAHIPFNFSRLINTGAAASKGEYLLLLNNDMEVIHADWLTLMMAYAQKGGVGTVGAKLLYPDDTIQHAGIVLGTGDTATHIYAHMPKDATGYLDAIKTVANYAAVTGACLLCSKENFNLAGGMDNHLEVEYNDLDLCITLVNLGLSCVYLPYVTLYHHESASRGHPMRSKRSYKQHLHDLTVFKKSWQHYLDNDPYYNPNRKIKFTGANTD